MEERCEFCEIVAGRAPAVIRHQEPELIVFKNRLTHVPVMLLIVPRRHMSQEEFWASPLFARAAALAVALGTEDAPGGFRLISNFWLDALQTQAHGHLHVLGGTRLGYYLRPGEGFLPETYPGRS